MLRMAAASKNFKAFFELPGLCSPNPRMMIIFILGNFIFKKSSLAALFPASLKEIKFWLMK